MLPSPRQFNELFDTMLSSASQGTTRKVNIYNTYGYFADMPYKPLEVSSRRLRFHGILLRVLVILSKKKHLITKEVMHPHLDDITEALRQIEQGLEKSCVILHRPSQSFIRTDVRHLLYQRGSNDNRFFCPPEYLSSEIIEKAFISYAQGCSWWKNNIAWRKE